MLTIQKDAVQLLAMVRFWITHLVADLVNDRHFLIGEIPGVQMTRLSPSLWKLPFFVHLVLHCRGVGCEVISRINRKLECGE